MSTDTNSVQACLGVNCLSALPQNPFEAGWREGYCPECLDEFARDEIRAERQDARNEVKRPTPITDAETMRDEYDHVDTEFGPFAPSETVSADFARALERQLAEAKELQSTWEKVAIGGELRRTRAERERNKAIEQRDRLAEACKRLMTVIGPPDAPIEQCWAEVDEIDEAWKAGQSALAILDRKEEK